MHAPTFKPLSVHDLPMVHAWLHRPHVAEWWRAPNTVAQLERDYLAGPMNATSTRAFIAMLDDEPIGFIQSYVAMGSGEGWWEQETDPGTRGIDQFLANVEQLGRGIGSAMVSAFVQRLFQDPAVTKVQTDPSPHNERAIRSYRRAGFVAYGEVITPDGPALLMFRHR
ncbi:MAG TPA: GNAT family N-acetyltransferase [Burkholderiaceae bacterium]|nr:GNAT family N-acetyltransferase [Burkholderiaceae bacterium]